ncbi:MAG: hypothetical protein AAGC44_15580 [Planctomycetota bacterium]
MATTSPPHPDTPQTVRHGKSLALIAVASVICMGLSFGFGLALDGKQAGVEALAGTISAALGGLGAWAMVALASGPGGSVLAAPVVGLMVRLVVTGAGVGLATVGLGFEQRPVLFAALFGYLVLMATETILLYRFASSDRREAQS